MKKVRSHRKIMLWPIILPVGLFFLCMFFAFSTICMWRAEIYYKTSFTEQEQELLRQEFNILPQSDIVFESGELRMDIRSMQDFTVRISGEDVYEFYLERDKHNDNTWYTWLTVVEESPCIVEMRRERFSDWETAHAFRDNPDVFDENRIIKQNLGLAWDQNGKEIFVLFVILYIVLIVGDIIRSIKRRKIANKVV